MAKSVPSQWNDHTSNNGILQPWESYIHVNKWAKANLNIFLEIYVCKTTWWVCEKWDFFVIHTRDLEGQAKVKVIGANGIFWSCIQTVQIWYKYIIRCPNYGPFNFFHFHDPEGQGHWKAKVIGANERCWCCVPILQVWYKDFIRCLSYGPLN